MRSNYKQLWQKFDRNIAFLKRQFFRRNCDHNIDPRSPSGRHITFTIAKKLGLHTCVIFKKLLKENNRPVGEHSPNLVTLDSVFFIGIFG
jgi:hypothetical protein